ncbi:putative harbinger transposase-derived protein, partial [Tanacetum coccineum]
ECTSAMRVLAYGASFDVVNEYLRISGAVTRKSLMAFVRGVISCFGDKYLRRPNEDDLARLLYVGEQHGFSGMTGSIDCMHWEWKNCPTGWAGQYVGRSGKPTIILEAIASYDLWIWHVSLEHQHLSNLQLLYKLESISCSLNIKRPSEKM